MCLILTVRHKIEFIFNKRLRIKIIHLDLYQQTQTKTKTMVNILTEKDVEINLSEKTIKVIQKDKHLKYLTNNINRLKARRFFVIIINNDGEFELVQSNVDEYQIEILKTEINVRLNEIIAYYKHL